MKGRIYIFLLLTSLLAACASIGSPDGGRYDEEPPVVVSSSPIQKAVNNSKKKIDILFNEYIKLDNAAEKVVISPPQTEMPNVRAVGKHVKVDLYDELKPNTTYTIDFGDAILDNNESNPMGQFTYSFSTGEVIDTMEVSGTVLDAQNLEPIKGIQVGLHRVDSAYHDSIFTTTPFLRVGRTNGSGRFTIKGIADGTYRIFALKDMDGNYAFNQKSETLAFDTTLVITSSKPDLRPDTIWQDSTHIEKIRMIPFIHYYPDEITLRAFIEDGQDMHLLKTERKEPESFTLYFTAPQDSLPIIKGMNFDADSQLIPEPSLHNDTITYWLRDSLVAWQDTLSFAMTYYDTDTLGVNILRTDTLELVPKITHSRMEKDRIKKSEEWQKDREKELKRSKKAVEAKENPYERHYPTFQTKPGTSIAPNQNIRFYFSEPIDSVDLSKLHFYEKVDSELFERPFLFERIERTPRAFTLYAEWEPKKQYVFDMDSLAVTTSMGYWTKSSSTSIRVRSNDEFGTLFIKLIGNDNDSCVVQLLDRSDKVVTQQLAENSRVDFYYLKPADYYMRMFIDSNGNGKWDTGNYAEGLQPEEVFYFPKPMPVKARWEMEQSWNYRSIPLNKQKPAAITKQKADKERTIKNRNAEREAQKKK